MAGECDDVLQFKVFQFIERWFILCFSCLTKELGEERKNGVKLVAVYSVVVG